MKTLFIDVTEEIIQNASREDSGHCMIADAIRAAIPEARNVTVDLQTIRYSDRSKGERYIWLTPEHCQRQLLRFDHGVKVEPWSFSLSTRPMQITPVRVRLPGGKQINQGSKKVRNTKVSKEAGVIQVDGGRTPPTAVLSHGGTGRYTGMKRKFGLRATEKFDPSV